MTAVGDFENSVPRRAMPHSGRVPRCIENLSSWEAQEDVTFHAGNGDLRGDNLLLASCEFFRSFLNEKGRAPSGNSTFHRIASFDAFELLTGYISTGRLVLRNVEEQKVLEILDLAHRYKLKKLETQLSQYLMKTLTVQNVCTIYMKAMLHVNGRLQERCCRFMDLHADAILRSETLYLLPALALKRMLSRDSFFADEFDIFLAVERWWAKRGLVSTVADVLEEVRLLRIDKEDLVNSVAPFVTLGLISKSRFDEAIRDSYKHNVKHRGIVLRGENVATANYRARLLPYDHGRIVFERLAPHLSLDWDRRMLKHSIGDDRGVAVELGNAYIINRLLLHLYDRGIHCYSYYVEVSMDCLHWDRIVDHSNRSRRSVQDIFFKPRVVRYIRVVGTRSMDNNQTFRLFSLEALYQDTDKEAREL